MNRPNRDIGDIGCQMARLSGALLVLASGLFANPAYGSHRCFYFHWGISWSMDSKWIRFRTFPWNPEGGSPQVSEMSVWSYTNFLHVETNSWAPDPKQPGARVGEDPETGRLFIANDEGLFTRSKDATAWEMVYEYPVFDMLHCPEKMTIIFHAAGNQTERGTFYASAVSGQILEDKDAPNITIRDIRILDPPRESPFQHLVFPEDTNTTTTSSLWEKDMSRSKTILAEWPGGARLERRGDGLFVICRNKIAVDVDREKPWEFRNGRGASLPVTAVQAAISPDQRLVGIVIYNPLDAEFPLPLPAGFIVVCSLDEGRVVARVPMREVVSALFGT